MRRSGRSRDARVGGKPGCKLAHLGLHGRLQRLDAALADAFRDVPVPPGLEARILARLAEAEVQQGAIATLGEATAEAEDLPVSGRKALWRPRRWWLLAAGSLAAAATVLIGVLSSLPQRYDFIRADFLALAAEHFADDSREGGRVFVSESQTPEGHPFSQVLRAWFPDLSSQFSDVRWRPVTELLGRQGAAYDLVGPGGVCATLYVVACSVEGLPSEPPLRPMLSSGASSVSAWQEGHLVYILAVAGGGSAYERLLATAAGPLT